MLFLTWNKALKNKTPRHCHVIIKEKGNPAPQQIKAKPYTIQGAFKTRNKEYLLSEEKDKATHDRTCFEFTVLYIVLFCDADPAANFTYFKQNMNILSV